MSRRGRARRTPARTRRAVIGALSVSIFAAGCGHVGSSALDHARSACDAYEHVGRVQISTTAEQASAVWDVARSEVRAAAAFDSRWADLSSDMQTALDLLVSTKDPPDPAADDFFEIDRRVQDGCSDAGRDIGDLAP